MNLSAWVAFLEPVVGLNVNLKLALGDAVKLLRILSQRDHLEDDATVPVMLILPEHKDENQLMLRCTSREENVERGWREENVTGGERKNDRGE